MLFLNYLNLKILCTYDVNIFIADIILIYGNQIQKQKIILNQNENEHNLLNFKIDDKKKSETFLLS